MRFPLVCIFFGLALSGCHQTTAFVHGDEAVKKDTDPPSCNDLEQHGKPVVLTGSREAAPSAKGGTIEDGTYVLTSSTLYTKARADGAQLLEMGKTTMVVKGSLSQLIRTDAEDRERRSTVRRVSAGTTTTLHTLCAVRSAASAEVISTSYTATPSSFQFITPGPAGTVVATYTRL